MLLEYIFNKKKIHSSEKSNPSGFGPPNILSVGRFRSILPRLTVYTSKPAIQAQAGRDIDVNLRALDYKFIKNS